MVTTLQFNHFCEAKLISTQINTAWKVSKYGAFSVPYFPVFSPNTGKYGTEKTQFLDTFHEAKPPHFKRIIFQSRSKPFRFFKGYVS